MPMRTYQDLILIGNGRIYLFLWQRRPPKPVVIPDEVIEKARSQHDILVKWMKSIGVDLCQEMEDVECQYILEAVQAKQKECDICHKKCFNTQRLRAHIRAKHMSTTPFQCKTCEKYFSDNNVLKLHKKTHDPVASVAHQCDVCQKGFPSMGRLNEHKKKHAEGILHCKFGCDKTCDEKKNMVAHELYCSKNPDKSAQSQCPYCPKKYDRLKSLKKHCKTHHESRIQEFRKGHGTGLNVDTRHAMIESRLGIILFGYMLAICGYGILVPYCARFCITSFSVT